MTVAPVRVCIILSDEKLRRVVTQELRDDAVLIAPDMESADMLVVEEAHPKARAVVQQWSGSGQGGRVLLIGSLDTLRAPWDGVDEVLLMPPRPGEIAGRVAALSVTSRRHEALFTAAIESAGDIIEIATPNAEYEYVNPAFERVLGYALHEVVGRTPGDIIRSDVHDPAYFKKIDETLSSGKSWSGVIVSKARDGRLVYLEGTIAPMRNAAGEVTHHMAVKRDITARIQAETELRRKREELEQARDAALEASRAKSQFLANMSHELRTPLNAIIGYSEMLMEDAEELEDQGVADDLSKIHKAGEHLLSLINDVLDISKIEAGAMKLHLEAFDLRTAVGSVVATVEPLCLERRNKLRVHYGDDLGHMRADLTKVRQTLMNLLGNAAKFTEEGEVTLRISKAIRGSEPLYEFEIRDTGIGIEPEQLKRLFRPFVQADASTSRRYGGTGLGLAISQRFCQMMGGRIDVTSEVGKGSVFTVLLPRMVESPTPTRETPMIRPRRERPGRLVLVVDDDEAVREVLTRRLDKQGFRVETAKDGAQGLARARELKPAAIVLDVMMPELDGWAVLTELKGNAATADIPVVLLTMLRKSEVGFALGAVDYLVKPVQTERLVSILHRYCRNDSAQVLIIDDDPNNRELMRRVLEGAGHVVREAAGGKAGIDAMDANVPDLVILDLMMPGVDGFAVLDRMREHNILASTPVVIVTAKDLSAEDHEMLRGAHAVFERGAFDRQELLEAVAQRVAELAN